MMLEHLYTRWNAEMVTINPSVTPGFIVPSFKIFSGFETHSILLLTIAVTSCSKSLQSISPV